MTGCYPVTLSACLWDFRSSFEATGPTGRFRSNRRIITGERFFNSRKWAFYEAETTQVKELTAPVLLFSLTPLVSEKTPTPGNSLNKSH